VLLRSAFAALADLDPPSGALVETVESLTRRLGVETLVTARDKARIVGCLFCTPRNQSLYLGRVAVDPAARRRGIGSALIEAASDEARQANLARLILGVRVALPENRRFFERCGFRAVGVGCHAGYSSPTFLIMARPLG
jgi:GNAT superfamily N-acetyltransferase